MNSNDHNASAGHNQSTLGNLKEQAGEKVSQVADTLKQEAVRREEGVRSSLSKQADQLASALRAAKSEIDPDSSIGKMFDYAADSVGSLAQNMKATDTSDLVHGVRDFARERPGAFLGICALGGFAAARFLLASAPDDRRSGTGNRSGSSYPGSSSASGFPGGSSRSYGTMGDSGSQARAMTGSMSGSSGMGAGTGPGAATAKASSFWAMSMRPHSSLFSISSGSESTSPNLKTSGR